MQVVGQLLGDSGFLVVGRGPGSSVAGEGELGVRQSQFLYVPCDYHTCLVFYLLLPHHTLLLQLRWMFLHSCGCLA